MLKYKKASRGGAFFCFRKIRMSTHRFLTSRDNELYSQLPLQTVLKSGHQAYNFQLSMFSLALSVFSLWMEQQSTAIDDGIGKIETRITSCLILYAIIAHR